MSWLLVIGLRFVLPLPADLQNWIGSETLRSELVLFWDPFTWQYSLALCTLALGVVLTEVVRAPEGDWQSWSVGFLLSGVGLLALQAGNMFTLVLGLTALDLISAGLGLLDPDRTETQFRFLAVRVAGTGLILLAGLMIPTFYAGPGGAFLGLLFFLGCGLRLGGPSRQQEPLPRGLGVLVDLAPVIAGLAAIFRLAPQIAAVTGDQALYSLAVLIAGLAAGLRWAGNKNLEEERPYWVLGSAAVFALIVLQGLPTPAMAWGLGVIYAGGVLFLYRLQAPWQVAIPAIGLWSFSALPFSPLAPGQAVFQAPIPIWVYLILPIHGLLLAGYLRRFTQVPPEDQDTERWVLLIFPSGLILLLVTFIVMSLLPWQGLDFIRQIPIWPGIAATALGGVLWWIFRRFDLEGQIQTGFNFVADFIYLFTRPVLAFLRASSEVMITLSHILEGQGGILWAILLIVLILSLITQVDLGGFTLGN